MAEKWDKQLMDLLKRTGDELKRTGDDLKAEAQRLMVEVQDPSKQAKVKEGLENLRGWALTTGKQAAERIESTVRRVEESVSQAFDRQAGAPDTAKPATPPPAARPSTDDDETVDASQPEPVNKETFRPAKSIGPKKTKKPVAKAAPAKAAPSKPAPAKAAPVKAAPAKSKGGPKSIGRKKPARPAS